MAETLVAIAGAEAVLDPAGALWLPASDTLVVADLHLEKSSSFARQGMLLPPYDTGATLALARKSRGAASPPARRLPGGQFSRPRRLRAACRGGSPAHRRRSCAAGSGSG